MVRRKGDGAATSASPSLAPISETKEAFATSSPESQADEDDTNLQDTTRTTSASSAAAAAAASSSSVDNANDNAAAAAAAFDPLSNDPGPIYVKKENTGEEWELTWPIWHLLSHNERKEIANRYNYKSIGEFEEFMTLTKAVGASGGSSISGGYGRAASAAAADSDADGDVAYGSSALYDAEADPRNYGLPTVAERSADDPRARSRARLKRDTTDDNDEEEEDGKPHAREVTDTEGDDSSTTSDDSMVQEEETKTANPNEELDEEAQRELVERGGYFVLLPDEMNHRILTYLNVDVYGVMALISHHWKPFTRTEAVYKLLCQRCYLKQSKRKALHVSRFGGSYRKMLETRPRVRTGGLYVLKYSKVKKIQRDMWTEIPVGAILEAVYYRYMYFFEESQVLYALTSAPPHEMIPRLAKMKVTGEKDKHAEWGRYEVQRNNVTVWASHPWHDVRFELRIIPADQKVDGARGRFTAMSFERHLSSASGNFDEYYSRDLVEYDVPSEYFRYLRDRRL